MINIKNDISARQNEILQCIIRKVKESGYPPTIREIAAAVNLSSSATIHAHLKKLEEYGYIRRDPTKPRAIELNPNLINSEEEKTPGESNTVYVPVVGKIAAGTPILADENIEDYFPLTPDFVRGKKDIFILKVKGDSMVNAGILDKDYIVLSKQDTAINGEIVAVLLDEEEATVKRFFKKTNSIKLMPENDFMEPVEVKDVKILGKVIGVIRKYF